MVINNLLSKAFVLFLVLSIIGIYCSPSIPQLGATDANPLSSAISFGYNLDRTQHVLFIISTIDGDPVDTLVNQVQEKGHHSLTPDFSGYENGSYVFRLQTEETTQVEKFVIKHEEEDKDK